MRQGTLVLSSLIFVLCASVVLCTSAVAAASASIEATLDPGARLLYGVEEVEVDPQYDTVYFLVLANLDREKNPFLSDRAIDERYAAGFEPCSTTIEAVEAVQTSGTVALSFRLLSLPPAFQTYSLAETVLAVDLPPSKGAIPLRISFVTEIPRLVTGDQEVDRGIVTWRFGWYPLLLSRQGEWVEEEGTVRLRSGGSVPLEIPSYDYRGRITLPGDYVLACGADHVEEVALEAGGDGTPGTKTYEITNDAPTRSIALAAGPSYERFALPELSPPVEVFALPGHDEEARLFSTYARDILADYEKRFGRYPRARLLIVESPNRDGLSMAADGIVWLSTLYFTHRNATVPGILDRFCEFTLAHEIAHQWWGIGVGADLDAQNWLSEGLSQYLALGYFEARYGEFGPNAFERTKKGVLENLVRSQFGFYNLREHGVELPYLDVAARGFDEAIVKPMAEVEYENESAVRLYDKGYLVARAIAAATGREAFEKGLREAAERFRYGTIDVEALRAVLEEASGRSLEEVFSVWLLGPGSVDYSIEIESRERTRSGWRTVVRVRRDGGAAQPVDVEATLASGKTERAAWDGVSEEGAVTFSTPEEVVRATIDPDHLLPDRERLNNNSPVKFVAVTGTNAYPLDAYVVRPDPLSRGATITYLNRLRLAVGEGSLSADVFQGRSHHLFLAAQLAGNDLAGTLGYTFTGFSRTPTGSPGTYWEPSFALTLSGTRLITDEGPLAYLHLGVTAYPSVQHSRSTAIGLDFTLSGAGRVEVAAFDEARLFPHVYLQGTVAVGVGLGDLPRPLWFDLSEFVSFGTVIGGQWVPAHFSGTQRVYGRLALEFPAGGDEPFNLANLMMVDRTRGRVFVACGATWTEAGELSRAGPKVEAGGEAVFDLSAIGGLLAGEAAVGYAVPVVGDGVGMIYFRFSL